VIAAQTLDQGPAWIQVVVREWSSALGEYIEPHNVIMIAAGDPPPPGISQVVFCGVTTGEIAEG